MKRRRGDAPARSAGRMIEPDGMGPYGDDANAIEEQS